MKTRICLLMSIVILAFSLLTSARGAWQQVSGISEPPIGLLLPIDNTLLGSGWDGGLYRSLDSGATWTLVSQAFPYSSLRVIALAGAEPNALCGTDGEGVYRSTNSGQTWESSTSGMGLAIVKALISVADTAYAGTYSKGIFRSTNGGASWAEANSGLWNKRVLSLAYWEASLYAGTEDGGVFRSTDKGTSWEWFSTGLSSLRVLSLTSTEQSLFAGTYNGGTFRFAQGDSSWEEAKSGMATNLIWELTSVSSMTFASTDGPLYRTTDNGQTWLWSSLGLPGGGSGVRAIGAQLYTSNNGHVFSRPIEEFLTASCLTCGDANSDGAIDISDAVFLISHIFTGGAAPQDCNYAKGKGDANGDTAVDISDAVYLISRIFSGGPAPHCAEF
jgi:photosystem II stability/assembly factor-like uncharacterized protein